jgi:hypothetical protein
MDLLMPVYLMEPIEVADLLAQEFRLREDWGSYHHVRAMAHEMGFHDGGRGHQEAQEGTRRRSGNHPVQRPEVQPLLEVTPARGAHATLRGKSRVETAGAVTRHVVVHQSTESRSSETRIVMFTSRTAARSETPLGLRSVHRD